MVVEMEMSKTYQYRKVMKPMLERKRRARINKCLDELKDIMVECLTQEGEHITRLEKADILELTVEHMRKLRQQKQLKLQLQQHPQPQNQDSKMPIIESFRAGYVHAANEISKALASVPGVSVELGTQLMSHLGHRLNLLQVVVPTVPGQSAHPTPIGKGLFPAFSSAVNSDGSLLGESLKLSQTYEQLQFKSQSENSSGISNPPFTSATKFNSSMGLVDTKTIHENNKRNNQRTSSVIITPPPSECSADDNQSCSSPTLSESGTVWRPW